MGHDFRGKACSFGMVNNVLEETVRKVILIIAGKNVGQGPSLQGVLCGRGDKEGMERFCRGLGWGRGRLFLKS